MSTPLDDRSHPWRLRSDLLTARILLWVATVGRGGELRPEVHLFFHDRYWRLALVHEGKGNARRAEHLKRKAERHWRLSGHDGPPFAGAMAMPPPRPWFRVSAVSRKDGPGKAA